MSQLRPPSQIPTIAPVSALGLQEMTDSQSNARAHTMGPPPQGIKRAFVGQSMRLSVQLSAKAIDC